VAPTERSELERVAETWREWFSRGEFDEGAAAMQAALEAPGAERPSSARVRVLYADSMFAFRQGARNARAAGTRRRRHSRASSMTSRGECDALTGAARTSVGAADHARGGLFARRPLALTARAISG
jgi:hypothetical protein